MFLFVWAMMTTPRIDVAEDVVTARSAIGRRRSVAFSQIDRAEVHLQMRSLTVFAEGVKFAKVSLESTCVSNLLARFAEGGRRGCRCGRGPYDEMAALLGGDTAFGDGSHGDSRCVVGAARVHVRVRRRWDGDPWLRPFPDRFRRHRALPLFMLIMPLRGIYVLGQQERELGFDFGKEMLARGATGTTHEDDGWFVDISNARVVAFRRDYVKRITSVEGSGSGDRCTVLEERKEAQGVRRGFNA